MFKVNHVFPSTGEWGSVTVETLDEAESWFKCKTSARPVVQSVVTLYDKNDNIIKQETVGN